MNSEKSLSTSCHFLTVLAKTNSCLQCWPHTVIFFCSESTVNFHTTTYSLLHLRSSPPPGPPLLVVPTALHTCRRCCNRQCYAHQVRFGFRQVRPIPTRSICRGPLVPVVRPGHYCKPEERADNANYAIQPDLNPAL